MPAKNAKFLRFVFFACLAGKVLMRYIALLRGINVGGNTMIKMADLKSSFEKLGFKSVVSYINSGNLAFDATKSTEEKIGAKIEKAIEKEFGKPVKVMVREQASITDVLEKNPYHGAYETHKQMHVLFMKEEMPKEKRDQLKAVSTEQEQFEVIGREIYALLKGGMAESLMGRGLIEKKFNVSITARNWRTVEKLAEL